MKKVAIIGAGQVAELVHANYYASRPNELELAAVFDVDQARAEAFAKKNHFGKAYSDVDQMLAEVKPNIVSVCTPNAFHHDLTIKALNSGADVICEKPPALTVSDAKEMYETATRHNRVLAYDFQHRYTPESVFLKEHLSQLGTIDLIDTIALRRSGVPGWGNFITKKIQGGGPLIDIGIHMLDAALHLIDYPEVDRVSAVDFHGMGSSRHEGTFGEWNPSRYSVEDSLFGALYLKNGTAIRISTSFLLNMEPEKEMNLLLYGQQAGASLYPAKLYTDQGGKLMQLAAFKAPQNQVDSHVYSMKAFVDACFSRDDSQVANGRQGYALQKVINALYDSADLHKEVKFS